MTTPTRSLKELFLVALDVPPEGRSLWLERQCGGDIALHEHLRLMLSAHDSPQSLLDRPGPEYPVTCLLARQGEGLTVDHTAESPGAIIGPYKLLQQIGEGGMGTVFMAEQTQPVQRRVALKIIKPGLDGHQVVARFEAERQALALMDHTNIARVFDGGTTENGRPYFVMELVHGVPITKYCDENYLTPRQRLELFVPVCLAIQHAHQKGIIHRDIKPSNVMITRCDGKAVPKVIDFGVAKATEERLTERTLFTQFGTMVGTLEYMSPEQAEMSPVSAGVDTRSDIYSLGVLLYELLTGSTPLPRQQLKDAAYGEALRLIKEEEPPKPSTRLSDSGDARASISANRQMEPAKLTRLLRGELDWIVMRALEKDRNRRYATANGFAADVQRYLANEPVQASPPCASYWLQKFVSRNRGPVLAVALVLLALVGGIIGTTWGMLRATDARSMAVDEANQKKAALQVAQESERGARDQLFLALWSQARASRLGRRMGQRLDSLDALDKAARIRPNDYLRDEAIAALALPDIRRVPGWHSSPPALPAVAYGSQYQLYARMDEPEVISIRTIPDDREVQRIASGRIQGTYLHFSPDDRFLLGLGDEYALRVWRVADGRPVLPESLRNCRAHAFSADSRQLAVGQDDWIQCFDLATGHEVNRWHIAARAHSLSFHPDHRKLAVGYFARDMVSVYDTVNGSLINELPVGDMNNQVIAWDPYGDRLAVAGTDPRIQIWNVSTSTKVAILEGHRQYVATLTFHPDGYLLASHGWDGMLLLWEPTSGRQLLRLPSLSAPRFSADGRWLGAAMHGEQSELLEVDPGREFRTLVSSASFGPGSYAHGDFSPDGQLLAVGMDTGTRLWSLQTGRELTVLPPRTNFVFFDAASSTGHAQRVTPSSGESPRWSLLTCGLDGLLRWPSTVDELDVKRLRLGPPRRLSLMRRASFAHSLDNGTLAAVSNEGGPSKLLDLQTGAVRLTVGIHPSGEIGALSSDGQWAASSGWHSDRVRLWNAATGRMVHEWVAGRSLVFFTPDSRTLIISRGDEIIFHDLETLSVIRRLPRDTALHPGHVAFSPDGKLIASEMSQAVIHLIEIATGRTVAKLEDPYGDRAAWQGFTPDGTQLAVVSMQASAVHLWDLRAIRMRLKDLNLDWDWPEFELPTTSSQADEPVAIEVLSGDATKVAVEIETPSRQEIERGFQAKIERSRQAMATNPNTAQACNNLAWLYLMAPEALRDPRTAVPLAEKAVQLAPDDPLIRNTLGVAYYRAGRFRDAVDVLRPNLEKQAEYAVAFDLYFMAMSYHCLGETEQGLDYFNLAVRWAWSNRGRIGAEHTAELKAFRAEAEESLGIRKNE